MGNSALGGRYGANAASLGPWGASRGASRATRIRARTMSPPAAPSGWRRRRRPSATGRSRIVNPRIEPYIDQIHEEVHDEEHQRHDEDHGLHGRIVALAHRLDEGRAHPGNNEDDLHDDESAEQTAAPPADEGHHGQERVPERVTIDDGPLREALGARRAHVVLADHLEHLRAGEPRNGRADVVGLGQGGPDQLLEVLHRALTEGHEFEGRDPVEDAHEAVEDEGARHEQRQAEPAQARDARQVVDGPVLVHGGDHPEGNGPHESDGEGEDGQLHRAGKALAEDVPHGPALGIGLAEVAAHGPPDPREVLDGHRLVQAQLLADLLDLLLLHAARLRARLVDEDLRDVPRHEPHEDEDQHGRPDQGGNEEQEPANNVAAHAVAPYATSAACAPSRWFGGAGGWSVRPDHSSNRPSRRNSGKRIIQSPATARVPSPPSRTAGTAPSSAAARPDSKAPSWLEVPVKSECTALTRPRIPSGVRTCARETRMTMLTTSAAPSTVRATIDKTKLVDSPKITVATPKMITERNRVDPIPRSSG